MDIWQFKYFEHLSILEMFETTKVVKLFNVLTLPNLTFYVGVNLEYISKWKKKEAIYVDFVFWQMC